MAEDHRRAMNLAISIDEMSHVHVDLEAVQTNMVYFSADGYTASQVAEHMGKHGIDMFDISPTHCRLVTHLHITDEDVENVVTALETLR
jgi:threonine aldolase